MNSVFTRNNSKLALIDLKSTLSTENFPPPMIHQRRACKSLYETADSCRRQVDVYRTRTYPVTMATHTHNPPKTTPASSRSSNASFFFLSIVDQNYMNLDRNTHHQPRICCLNRDSPPLPPIPPSNNTSPESKA